MFEPENFYGNIEYKLYISSKKNDRLFSQFLFRMREGNGKAIYIIGITDNGKLHIKNIKLIYYSIKNFLNIIQDHANYKIRLFIYNDYIYAIITLSNNNIIKKLEFI
jgi:GTPase|tara:strand:- start:71 stop:391 length:321 start_codon:yes stop_codon:yes gene_type:complete